MERFPTPIEIREEEKVFGFVASARQAGYLLGGALSSFLVGFLVLHLVGIVSHGLAQFLTVCSTLALFGSAWALGWAPAPKGGILGIPGPKVVVTQDQYDPPIRLDQWLWIVFQHRRKVHVLPYRREVG